MLQKFLDIWRGDRQRTEQDEHLGEPAFLSPCSSSVIRQPLSPLPFTEQPGRLWTDEWLPYGLLPFHPLLFSQLRDLGEEAATWGCTPSALTTMTAERRAGRRTALLHPTAQAGATQCLQPSTQCSDLQSSPQLSPTIIPRMRDDRPFYVQRQTLLCSP